MAGQPRPISSVPSDPAESAVLRVVPGTNNALRQILGEKIIGYHAALAKALGSVTAGILLSQLLYWQPRATREDGWFWKTRAQISDELALSRYEQEGARKILVAAGVIEEKLIGVPSKLHFRVNLEAIVRLLDASPQVGENQPPRWGKTSHLGGGKPASKVGENQPTITESTTESTSESTSETPRPPEGERFSPPLSGMAPSPEQLSGQPGEERPPPPTPAPIDLARAEAAILDFGRSPDRPSTGRMRADNNGWDDQPPERLPKIQAALWDEWRQVNPERVSRKDLALVARAVAPDQVTAFQRRTRAYLGQVSPQYLKKLKTWLEEWQDWAPAQQSSAKLEPPGPLAEIAMMVEGTRRANARKELG